MNTATGPQLAHDIAAHGIELPADVTALAERLAQLKRRAAATPAAAHHRATAVDALAADPDADIGQLVADADDAETLRKLLGAAVDRTASALTGAMTTHHSDIVAGIRTALFAPAVKALTAAAKLTSAGDDPTALLRAGRTKEAHALADADRHASDIQIAYKLRTRLYSGRSGIDNMVCSHWTPPPADGVLDGLSGAARFMAGIRSGSTPWLGTLPECEDASRAHQAQLEEQQKADIAAYARKARYAVKAQRATVVGK